MIRFECDYATGAHPQVLQALVETNGAAVPGYGEDAYCEAARQTIRTLCQAPEAMVQFIPGGTQTNMTVIAAALRPYEGALCADSGHINCHETGAVEGTGHKVLALPGQDGKLTAEQVDSFCRDYYDDPTAEHMVRPGLVYLSQPTELGTVYTLAELEAMRQAADRWGLKLFIDGARLACALAASDVTLVDLARLCDVFYIGGTKCGALCGEAVVFTHGNMPRQFETMVKRHGAMVAKGRLNAVQFDALFTDGLYEKICAPAVRLALKLRDGLAAKGYRFAIDSPTNQQFIIVENSRLPELGGKVAYSFIEKYDAEHTVIRLATSWVTTEEQVDELLNSI